MDKRTMITFYGLVDGAVNGKVVCVDCRRRDTGELVPVICVATETGVAPVAIVDSDAASHFLAPDADAETVCGCPEHLAKAKVVIAMMNVSTERDSDAIEVEEVPNAEARTGVN